ncbi:MAG: DUF6320 domain-containing protein [Anaerolineae bacterium]
MPYCVNCGVELKSDAKECPLCHVRVVLPAELREPTVDSAPPQQRDVVTGDFNKYLWIQVISALMAIPALLSLVVNAVFGDGLTWSLYVVASLATVWVWCISPFLYRRNIVPLWIVIDAAALLGLLYVVNALPPASNWFLPLALPIITCLTLLVLVIVELIRRGVLRELHIVAAALVAIAVLCIVIEGAVDLYLTGALRLQWSLLVLVSSLPLALVATMLQRHRPVVEGMKMWLRM